MTLQIEPHLSSPAPLSVLSHSDKDNPPSGRYFGEETLHKEERTLTHGSEKCIPLLLVVVGVAGSIADNADANEGNLLKVTSVSYGCGLHLACKAIRKPGFDLLK